MESLSHKILVNDQEIQHLPLPLKNNVEVEFLEPGFTPEEIGMIRKIIDGRSAKLIFNHGLPQDQILQLLDELRPDSGLTSVVLNNLDGKITSIAGFVGVSCLNMELLNFNFTSCESPKLDNSVQTIVLINCTMSAGQFLELQCEDQPAIEFVNCSIVGCGAVQISGNMEASVQELRLTKLQTAGFPVQLLFKSASYENLQCLQLRRCNLFDEQVAELLGFQWNMPWLSHLDLGYNFLTSNVFVELERHKKKIPGLQLLNLTNNKVSKAFIGLMWQSTFLRGIQTVYLSNNIIHCSVQNIPTLGNVILSNNYISGATTFEKAPSQFDFPETDTYLFLRHQKKVMDEGLLFSLAERYFGSVYEVESRLASAEIGREMLERFIGVEVQLDDAALAVVQAYPGIAKWLNVTSVELREPGCKLYDINVEEVLNVAIPAEDISALLFPNAVKLTAIGEEPNLENVVAAAAKMPYLRHITIELEASDAVCRLLNKECPQVLFIQFNDRLVTLHKPPGTTEGEISLRSLITGDVFRASDTARTSQDGGDMELERAVLGNYGTAATERQLNLCGLGGDKSATIVHRPWMGVAEPVNSKQVHESKGEQLRRHLQYLSDLHNPDITVEDFVKLNQKNHESRSTPSPRQQGACVKKDVHITGGDVLETEGSQSDYHVIRSTVTQKSTRAEYSEINEESDAKSKDVAEDAGTETHPQVDLQTSTGQKGHDLRLTSLGKTASTCGTGISNNILKSILWMQQRPEGAGCYALKQEFTPRRGISEKYNYFQLQEVEERQSPPETPSKPRFTPVRHDLYIKEPLACIRAVE